MSFPKRTYWLIAFFLAVACSDDAPVPQEPEEEEPPSTPEFHVTADWMQQLLYDYPGEDLTLHDICLPRSHDAGTYILQNCTAGANACNTQTQHRDMTRQLTDGIRNFDIRPVLRNNVYFTQHTTGCGGLGCSGDRVGNMLGALKDFLDAHAELVILEFGHWCDTGPDDDAFRELVTEQLGDRLYREPESDPVPFIRRPLNDLLPDPDGTGLAVAVYSGAANNASNRADGVFAPSFIPRAGSYANAQDYGTMKADQFGKYASYANDGTELFEFSWTLTQNDELAIACAFPWNNPVSIRDLAGTVNPELDASMDELVASGDIRQGRIPNVISVDFCEPFVTETCLRISRLNLGE